MTGLLGKTALAAAVLSLRGPAELARFEAEELVPEETLVFTGGG